LTAQICGTNKPNTVSCAYAQKQAFGFQIVEWISLLMHTPKASFWTPDRGVDQIAGARKAEITDIVGSRLLDCT
jgi:hypothetical protein